MGKAGEEAYGGVMNRLLGLFNFENRVCCHDLGCKGGSVEVGGDCEVYDREMAILM